MGISEAGGHYRKWIGMEVLRTDNVDSSMKNVIAYLKDKYPGKRVGQSVDKNFVLVSGTIGSSNFGKNGAGEQVIVPIYNTSKIHVDTARLEMGLVMTSKRIKKELDKLTDEERMDLFGNYCKHCGCEDPTCRCWDDT